MSILTLYEYLLKIVPLIFPSILTELINTTTLYLSRGSVKFSVLFYRLYTYIFFSCIHISAIFIQCVYGYFLQHNVQCVGIAAIFRTHNSFQPRYRHHSQVGLIISFSFETQGEIYYRLYYLLFLCKNNNNIHRNTYEIYFYFIFAVFVSIKVRLRT